MPYSSTELYANKNHSLSDDTTDWKYKTLKKLKVTLLKKNAK